MKSLLFTPIFALVLVGCATASGAYGPKASSAFGFSDTQVEDDRFRISYSAGSQDKARDYALLRAAQLTKEGGFDWFRIVGGEMINESGQRRSWANNVSVGVGVGRGWGYGRRGGSYGSVGIGIHDILGAMEGEKVTSAIEIKTGNGAAPDGEDVYVADEILEHIRPETFR